MLPSKTTFSDVCGTVDEFKRRLHEDDESVASNPIDTLNPLLSDAEFMIGRMQERVDAYQAFKDSLREILSQLDDIDEVESGMGVEAIGVLHDSATSGESIARLDVEKMCELAEQVRTVAGAQEHYLRLHKDLALRANQAFVDLKGSRPWVTTEKDQSSLVESVRSQYQAWLPPEPHRDRLLNWLSRSRAHLPKETGPGGEPYVQFEDGGCILMSQVRWNEEIGNFQPASMNPKAVKGD